MSYEIAFDQRATYLYARIVGSNTPETILAYMQEIVAKCIEIDCFRVLIHECLDGPRLATLELFETVSEISLRILGKFDAIAYVDEKMGELKYFGETVAVNRGMPLAAFTDLESATRWILAQTEDSNSQQIFRGNPEDDDGF